MRRALALAGRCALSKNTHKIGPLIDKMANFPPVGAPLVAS
ncbi:hypothetical protein BN2497_143 [Janthinobacterium sp. CG23_2]|nr:hypothetical protein BN2497_143 [Janthinobacterium sp. CG23_2]CUU26469.1 hypothetical protein BN3177_143 [Janthinobacterium sp. CG23_2]